LDIGSAKPSADERAAAEHHMLDRVEPDASYDAATYARDADQVIADLSLRGRRAVIVGGTGLYTRALVRGLADGIASDPVVRESLNARARQGEAELSRMHAELTAVDPAYASKIARTDPIRIVRGLEVFAQTGVALSEHHAKHAAQPPRYRALWLGLDVDREALRPKIAARAGAMLSSGWIDEVRAIIADYSSELRSLRSVGYAEVTRFVTEGRTDIDALRDEIVHSTLAFAKRQRTWFRGEPEVRWDSPESLGSERWLRRVEAFFRGESDSGAG
jgi:tRNA dimethylallyltransferase